MSWDRDQTRVAVAAAAVVLDGDVVPPTIACKAPARIFERDLTLALATLASGGDGAAAIDAALLRSLPPHPDAALVELAVLTAGYQLIVALAVAGHPEDAEVLRAELAPRLARALGG